MKHRKLNYLIQKKWDIGKDAANVSSVLIQKRYIILPRKISVEKEDLERPIKLGNHGRYECLYLSRTELFISVEINRHD